MKMGNSSAKKNLRSDIDIDDDNDNTNYGSMAHTSSDELLADDQEEESSLVIDKNLPLKFPECVVDTSLTSHHDYSEFGDHQLDVPSDISNQSSSNIASSSDDDCSYESSEYDEDEIEKPHQTLGLILFDFVRFVAIGANVRCINTQMVPIFLTWGHMEVLHVALRIFMTLFSALLILVEFPDLFPFLQHAPNNNSSSSLPPPLYIINWIPRGIFYIFLAIICFEQSIVVRALDQARHASTSSRFFDAIFIVVSGGCMLVVGAVYILFGLCCLQKIMERVRKDEKEKWKEYHEKVHTLELETEQAEEREWLLENGHYHEGDGEEHDADIGGGGRRCWQRCSRWRRRCKRRRLRGRGGLCYQLGCRTVDWRC